MRPERRKTLDSRPRRMMLGMPGSQKLGDVGTVEEEGARQRDASQESYQTGLPLQPLKLHAPNPSQ